MLKLLSEDPKNYSDAPREGIRRILEEVTGIPHPRDKPVPHERIESIRMGTTVATNALLERKGARMAFFVTAGFKDLLHIGNQSRPHIFDLKIEKPDNLYERVVEVQERVLLQREEEQNVFPAPGAAAPSTSPVIVTGTTGEKLVVEQAPDRETLRKQLQEVKDAGITSIAVALMHSYTYPAHEQLIAEVARELGFQQSEQPPWLWHPDPCTRPGQLLFDRLPARPLLWPLHLCSHPPYHHNHLLQQHPPHSALQQ